MVKCSHSFGDNECREKQEPDFVPVPIFPRRYPSTEEAVRNDVKLIWKADPENMSD